MQYHLVDWETAQGALWLPRHTLRALNSVTLFKVHANCGNRITLHFNFYCTVMGSNDKYFSMLKNTDLTTQPKWRNGLLETPNILNKSGPHCWRQ